MLVTTNTHGRHRLFLDPTYARIAVDSLYLTQERYPFFLFAFVIMPDHCHFLVRTPEGQQRFHLRLIDNPSEAMKYIHANPVRAKLCTMPEEYPWSSATGRWDVSDIEWFHGV